MEHVRPGHSPFVADHGRLRHPHFRLTNAEGQTSLVKFHWKPKAGVHSLTWEEAQMIAGLDPDFHRRDLANAIEAGAFPQWDFAVQVLPDSEEEMFEGIDLLDRTKFVPEELAPVQVIGTMTLNANPTNYFAETEQVAFHPGHLVPGIDVTNDPLLQGRLFSYIDTQISRLGGPNFAQLPINRTHAPVNDMLRDGMHQSAVHGGAAPYRPNSLDGGNPFVADADAAAFIEAPQQVAAGRKVREHPATFADHFSQARQFFRSLSALEQDHVIGAYTFELAKCYEENIKLRQLQALANIDPYLCSEVANGVGLSAPEATEALSDEDVSPALSQLGDTWPVVGRQVGIIADDTTDIAQLTELRTAIHDAGMVPLVVAPTGAKLGGALVVQRTYVTAASIEFDAIVLATAARASPRRHRQPRRQGRRPFRPAGHRPAGGQNRRRGVVSRQDHRRHRRRQPGPGLAGLPGDAPGVVTGTPAAVVTGLTTLLAGHRAWDRFAVAPG